jgi:hypothetical protein
MKHKPLAILTHIEHLGDYANNNNEEKQNDQTTKTCGRFG